jgi:enterochelin esterase-like enzyme
MTRRLAGFVIAVLGVLWAQAAIAGELRREVVFSASLGQDLPFLVYLPDGYAESGQNYPVLYLLHGFGDNERTWMERAAIQTKADKMIAAGIMPRALIVMPGCTRCWWTDGAKDKPETAFWNDLVPAVTARFRTIDKREGRVIAGLSAGGYGALRFALKYPDRFAAAAALSPAIYAEAPPAASAARISAPFVGPDGQFSLPAWTEQNYPRLMGRYFDQARRVPLYLVSGDSDKLGIAYETALCFKRLMEKQPDLVEMRVVDGGHSWAVWSNAVDDAMAYLFRFTERPQQAGRPVRNGLAQNTLGVGSAPPNP